MTVIWLLVFAWPLSLLAALLYGVAIGENRYHRRLQRSIRLLEARRAARTQHSAEQLGELVRAGIESI